MDVFDLIKKHEGLKLKPYIDMVGKITIGWGRNLDDVGITELESEMLLKNDVERAVLSLTHCFTWYSSLDDVRKAVLIDMVFNLGIQGFLKFVMTIEHLMNGEYDLAADTMLDSKWAHQVGDRAVELSEMMRSGKWCSL
jgi:lysozyme